MDGSEFECGNMCLVFKSSELLVSSLFVSNLGDTLYDDSKDELDVVNFEHCSFNL